MTNSKINERMNKRTVLSLVLLSILLLLTIVPSALGPNKTHGVPNPNRITVALAGTTVVDPAWWTGPYQVVTWFPGDYIELTRNAEYPGGWPAPGCGGFVDTVIIRWVPSWTTRLALFLSNNPLSQADIIEVPPQYWTLVEKLPPVRRHIDQLGNYQFERHWVQRWNYSGYYFYYMWKTVDADLNNDHIVNILDVGILNAHWWDGSTSGMLGYDPVADISWQGRRTPETVVLPPFQTREMDGSDEILPGADGFVDLYDVSLMNAQYLDTVVPT